MSETSPYEGLYAEHPVRPSEPQDPLEFFAERQRALGATTGDARRLKLAYAARWEAVPEGTWSGSATNLLESLRDVADADDIGVHFPDRRRAVLRLAAARYRDGGIKSNWANSRLTNAYLDRVLASQLDGRGNNVKYDATLTIDSLAVLPEPYFIYYDVSWDSLIGTAESPARYLRHHGITPALMARMRARQRAIYDKASGIFTMSHWLAKSLIEESGVPASKVHVIHPGVNTPRGAPDGGGQPAEARRGPRRKLLFIGRQWDASTFYLKGADLLADAFEVLRKEYDPELTLTMVGVTGWPANRPVPDGIALPGVLPPGEVRKLYETHDLLVVPSRLEGFGIVFAEATSHGIPCVARNRYAMPETVVPGLSGALIGNDDPHELAEAIIKVLADDQLYETCAARAPRVREYFTWERASREICQIIAKEIS
jgi:glycosyltransferase involved in cell wall biosynthesis